MLTIRLQRFGKRNNPSYRVVLTESKNAPKSGRFLEILGHYNPQRKEDMNLNAERIQHWLSKGVQTSDTMHNLLVKSNLVSAPKRSVVPPSKLKAKVQEAKVPDSVAKEASVESISEVETSSKTEESSEINEAPKEEKKG